jgi:hypothetical protein
MESFLERRVQTSLGDGSLVGEIEPFLPESTLEKQLGQLLGRSSIRREPDLVQPASPRCFVHISFLDAGKGLFRFV